MLIDFHTHIFPDEIAEQTLKKLQTRMIELNEAEQYEVTFPLYGDGTLDCLKTFMNETGIDLSVVMPIATREGQTAKINRFAELIRCDKVISFGSVFPFQKDWESVMEGLVEHGFIGVKLHPEFQKFYVDSHVGIRLLKKAEQLGLLVTLHTGVDLGFKGPLHCNPKMLRNVLQEVDGSNIIAAHLGGLMQWEEVEHYLVGTNIMLDTAYVSKHINQAQYKRIIQGHGADKILFGSDVPWEHPKDTLNGLRQLELDEHSMQLILCDNALRLLKQQGVY